MATRLRWFGVVVLIFNLWLSGRYHITGFTLLVMTFGFAIGFELFVVRAVASRSPEPDVESAKSPVATVTSHESAPEPLAEETLDQKANKYGIVSESGRYRYKEYWYDRLEDAVAYAEIDRSRVMGCK